MNSKASCLVSFALFLLFSSAAAAFNITKLLGRHPNFSSFNDYLTQTQISQQINSRNTITVLAVDNKAIASISGKPLDTIKKILSVHVVLDYFDVQKLTMLPKKTTILTTLFQSSGAAANQEGFLNVSLVNEGEIAFGSAVKGSILTAKLVSSVAAQPYNISVLQITAPIVPPSIDQAASPPKAAKSPAAAPKKSPATPPTQAPSSTPAVEAPTPSQEVVADAPVVSPSSAPVADAPVVDNTPVGSPTADDEITPSPAPASEPKSDSSHTGVAFGIAGVGVVMGLVSSLVAF
ncbi:fasciclin-like arabinogalactan protein 3 [Corylus avellana]|uniref:fasciclin-like arabinogalactan protein 3 n=1 Tax=Corylus avellana TaxID=13451 RepID=UPI00286BF689|nr:fasciclin-like arabinogalactan protein 3 [Corylus avellana]